MMGAVSSPRLLILAGDPGSFILSLIGTDYSYISRQPHFYLTSILYWL